MDQRPGKSVGSSTKKEDAATGGEPRTAESATMTEPLFVSNEVLEDYIAAINSPNANVHLVNCVMSKYHRYCTLSAQVQELLSEVHLLEERKGIILAERERVKSIKAANEGKADNGGSGDGATSSKGKSTDKEKNQ